MALTKITDKQVTYKQGSTGSVVKNLGEKLREIVSSSDFLTEANVQSAATSAITGGFWADKTPKPNIRRIPGRLFLGEGVTTSGDEAFNLGSNSWLADDFGAYWFERGTQLLSLPEDQGYIGVVGAARTSTSDPVGNVAIGNVSVVWNEGPLAGGADFAWAQYIEAVLEAGAGGTYGQEIAIKNKSSNARRNPYQLDYGGGIGTWYAGGGDSTYGGAPANPSNAAIVIGRNSSTWNSGIVFDASGITGTDGLTGTASAMSLARGHKIEWWASSSARGATLLLDSNAALNKSIVFRDTTVNIETDAAPNLFSFDVGLTGANGLQFAASAAGGGKVSIRALGADSNIDIELAPKVGGVLRYALPFNASADVPITGFMYIKDNAGTLRKLAIIA